MQRSPTPSPLHAAHRAAARPGATGAQWDAAVRIFERLVVKNNTPDGVVATLQPVFRVVREGLSDRTQSDDELRRRAVALAHAHIRGWVTMETTGPSGAARASELHVFHEIATDLARDPHHERAGTAVAFVRALAQAIQDIPSQTLIDPSSDGVRYAVGSGEQALGIFLNALTEQRVGAWMGAGGKHGADAIAAVQRRARDAQDFLNARSVFMDATIRSGGQWMEHPELLIHLAALERAVLQGQQHDTPDNAAQGDTRPPRIM